MTEAKQEEEKSYAVITHPHAISSFTLEAREANLGGNALLEAVKLSKTFVSLRINMS